MAGVTDATNSGGHGSDTALRRSEALARSTVLLSDQPDAIASPAESSIAESSWRSDLALHPDSVLANRQLGVLLAREGKAAEAVLFLQHASGLAPDDAEVHHLLGDVDEKLGNALDAVREYQRAAELDPSERNLFGWGTELLTHRALEPASEVFTRGNRLFPKSARMLIALGVTWYARGTYDQAAQYLIQASDLVPDDPTPYFFLGRVQSEEANPSKEALERLARFAHLQPGNALANYYYAVGLLKASFDLDSVATDRSARVEALLLKALELDPKLGAADIQLGILYAQRSDFSGAISAVQKAIDVSSELDTLAEAHYRLAKIYSRMGDQQKAQVELQLHDGLTKKNKEQEERERHAVQEFLITVQNKASAAPIPR